MASTRIALHTRVGGRIEPVAEVELPPELSARYEVGPLLGAGAMGSVYRATERQGARVVALKLMHALDDPRAVARFVSEGKLLRGIDHPNVLKLHELAMAGGHPVLVAEYVDGGSLRDLMDRGRTRHQRMQPLEACRIARQCLQGLQACHAQGIVHRDFKPENVLLTGSAVVKLADLGVAKKYGGHAPAGHDDVTSAGLTLGGLDATRTGALIGTPRYMAPEQARGEAVVVASDLHAVGAVLYEMIAGVPVFPENSLPELLDAIETRAPRPLSDIVPVPPELSALVSRALAKPIHQRPASAEEFAVALGRVMTRLGRSGKVARPGSDLPKTKAGIAFRALANIVESSVHDPAFLPREIKATIEQRVYAGLSDLVPFFCYVIVIMVIPGSLFLRAAAAGPSVKEILYIPLAFFAGPSLLALADLVYTQYTGISAEVAAARRAQLEPDAPEPKELDRLNCLAGAITGAVMVVAFGFASLVLLYVLLNPKFLLYIPATLPCLGVAWWLTRLGAFLAARNTLGVLGLKGEVEKMDKRWEDFGYG